MSRLVWIVAGLLLALGLALLVRPTRLLPPGPTSIPPPPTAEGG